MGGDDRRGKVGERDGKTDLGIRPLVDDGEGAQTVFPEGGEVSD